MNLKKEENSSALMVLHWRNSVVQLHSKICLSIQKQCSISLLPVIGVLPKLKQLVG